MDLKDILEKNKRKLSKFTDLKMPTITTVAVKDRPYNLDFESTKETIPVPVVESKMTDPIENQVTEEVTKRKQKGNLTGNKQVPIRKQTGNKGQILQTGLINIQKQTDNNSVTEKVTYFQQNGKQTGNSIFEQPLLVRLIGLQRLVILFFYLLARKNLSQTTNPVTLDHISGALNIEKSVLKTTIIRLQKKGCIVRNEGKIGRGGWSSFTITNGLYQEIMQHERQGFLDKELIKNDNNLITKRETEQVTALSSSSSINIITTTTTTTTTEASENQWEAVDIEPLQEIGFTKNHLLQIAHQNKLSPEIVQDSINAFAFDLKKNNKSATLRKRPLDFFMGILRNGTAYAPPDNYESPKDEAMRLYVEQKERELKLKHELESRSKEIEFQEWSNKLTEAQLMEFYVKDDKLDSVPEKVKMTLIRRAALNNAREYFENFIWSSRLREIIN